MLVYSMGALGTNPKTLHLDLPTNSCSNNDGMPRPLQATIHTAALIHNIASARAVAPDAKVWAIVKANAYGHGIERAFEGLKSADGFALLDLDEAKRLRALDWRGPREVDLGRAAGIDGHRPVKRDGEAGDVD